MFKINGTEELELNDRLMSVALKRIGVNKNIAIHDTCKYGTKEGKKKEGRVRRSTTLNRNHPLRRNLLGVK